VLEDDGKNIRRRVDELMRVLGAKFPIYVLVTKCDLIQGMNPFCNRLSEKGLDQAMGVINQKLSTDISLFLKRAMGSIVERLRDYRLLIFHKPSAAAGHMAGQQGIDPAPLLFPEEFERLQSGLDAFFKGAFQENPYQETPILRGVYFSSGRQEGAPYSHFLKDLGLIEERDVLPGTSKGLFLHDFFSRILPKDRDLFAPTQRAMDWNRLTKHLGLTSWLAVGIAVCGLLSYSFVKNLGTIRDITDEFPRKPELNGTIYENVNTMERFRQAIILAGERNRGWWVPRFGLDESQTLERDLKIYYSELFEDKFLVKFDKQMSQKIAEFSSQTSDDVIGAYVSHLVRRINLIRARRNGDELDTMQAMPPPSYEPIFMLSGQKIIPELVDQFENLYLYYLWWKPDQRRSKLDMEERNLEIEMEELLVWLKHIVTLKDSNLNWLVNWANQNPSLTPIQLEDFWGASLNVAPQGIVPAAFTIAGRDEIYAFLNEIEAALIDQPMRITQKVEFEDWYRAAYVKAWENFSSIFPSGAERLTGKDAWQQVAERIGTREGPYFALLELMVSELKPTEELSSGEESSPPWITLVYDFEATKQEAANLAETQKEKPGFLKKIAKKVTKTTKKATSKVAKFEKQTGVNVQRVFDSESLLLAALAYGAYQKALTEISAVAASRETAFEMAKAIYAEDPATSQSPFFAAWLAEENLKSTLQGSRSEPQDFWQLVQGPLDFFHTYVTREAECQLQDLWEKEVLVKVKNVTDVTTLNDLLFGQQGYANKFLAGSGEFFIEQSLAEGYFAKEMLGKSVSFDDDLFAFLEKGAEWSKPRPEPKPPKSNYSVTIKGIPTDVNPGAKLGVHLTRLELNCGSSSNQILENWNDYHQKVFNWSPASCGDVVLKIEIADLLLYKEYSGDKAFAYFLKDFKTGQRTFYRREFPTDQAGLKRLGIDYIKVRYDLRDHQPVLKILRPGIPKTKVPQPPRYIVTCWDQ
jgi:type VI secretion system protein ImpL